VYLCWRLIVNNLVVQQAWIGLKLEWDDGTVTQSYLCCWRFWATRVSIRQKAAKASSKLVYVMLSITRIKFFDVLFQQKPRFKISLFIIIETSTNNNLNKYHVNDHTFSHCAENPAPVLQNYLYFLCYTINCFSSPRDALYCKARSCYRMSSHSSVRLSLRLWRWWIVVT